MSSWCKTLEVSFFIKVTRKKRIFPVLTHWQAVIGANLNKLLLTCLKRQLLLRKPCPKMFKPDTCCFCKFSRHHIFPLKHMRNCEN